MKERKMAKINTKFAVILELRSGVIPSDFLYRIVLDNYIQLCFRTYRDHESLVKELFRIVQNGKMIHNFWLVILL